MTYTFDTDIAQRFGINEAILIQNLVFWIRKNEANDKHFHDGRYWTYNSAEAFAQLFPFWTVNQVRRLLARLVEIGVLVKGNYNASQYDRTMWYGFANSFLQNCKIHFANLQNGSDDIARCNNTNINTNNKPNNNINNNIHKDKDISLFDKVEGIKEESVRGEKEGEFARHTIENLCIFPDSKFAKFEDFAAEFKAPEYAQIDIYYYWQVIMDWSRSNANKKRDWIATARNWIRNDAAAGKLKRVQQQAGVALSPDAVHYLEMAGGLFDE